MTSAAPSQNELVLARLQATPGVWVDMPELSSAGRSLNIHSRIADLRARGHQIQQRSLRRGRLTCSQYRLL